MKLLNYVRKLSLGVLLPLAIIASLLAVVPSVSADANLTETISGDLTSSGSYLSTTPLVVSGAYTVTTGVKEVRMFIFDRTTSLYLAPDGTWTTLAKYLTIPVSPVGATTANYTSAPLTLASGSYRIGVKGVDMNGVVSTPTNTFITVTSPAAGAPAYLSIMFGRSAYQQTASCKPLVGSRTLTDAVAYAAAQGKTSTGGVVTDKTPETGKFCEGSVITYPSWADLAMLRDNYGFTVVSQSKTYNNWINAKTAAQVQAESCGTLPIFQAHGHTRAWGMFNSPNNLFDPSGTGVTQPIINSCFAFGRAYAGVPSTKAQALVSPYRIKTLSVTSGMCNNPALPCYTLTVKNNRRYMTPSQLSSMLNPSSDQYSVVQFYRFVEGKSTATGATTWDCTSPDANDHWVTTPEVYCFNDYQAAIGMIGGGVTVTDPATVASAWGRLPR